MTVTQGACAGGVACHAHRRRARRPRLARDERGNAVTYLGACGVFLAALAGLFAITLSYAAAAHQAQAAADLAALAGAQAAAVGEEACPAADRIARANHAEVSACSVMRGTVEVEIRVRVRQPFAGLPEVANRRAVAAPVEP